MNALLIAMKMMIVIHILCYICTLNSRQAVCDKVRNFLLALHNSPAQCAQYNGVIYILSCKGIRTVCIGTKWGSMGLVIRALVQVPHFNLCCVLRSYITAV